MISKEKLIVRISGFGKNSVSKFWKNKKLNVLDMGYTLIKGKICATFWFCSWRVSETERGDDEWQISL